MKIIELVNSEKPNIEKLPGGWEPNFSISLKNTLECEEEIFRRATIYSKLFSPEECDEIISKFMQSPKFENVTVQGIKDVPDDRIGSIRTTVWSPSLADLFWEMKFKNVMREAVVCEMFNERTPTDWWQGNKERTLWKAVGLSPMLRFMKYENGGQHYAHYDAGHIYKNDRYRTLYSFVMYLTTNEGGGTTRFIKDDQENIVEWERNHEDWPRESREDEVLFRSKPIKGNVLIFPHRMCHDVEKYLGDTPRIIIRGDVLFEAL